MNFRRNKIRIIIAAIIGIVAFITVHFYLKNMQNEINTQKKLIQLMQQTQADMSKHEYFIAAKDLEAGYVIKAEDAKPLTTQTKTPDAIMDIKAVIGEPLLEPIKAETILTTKLFAKTIIEQNKDKLIVPNEYSPLTLDISNFQGISSNMLPGKVIDMYSTSKDFRWQLNDVKIIACDNTATEGALCKSLTQAKTVTFAVPNEKISEIIESMAQSKMLLVLKNPNDKSAKTAKSTTNVNYTKASLPKRSGANYSNIDTLPDLPNLNSPDVQGLPAPFMPQVSSGQAIEVIQANIKTRQEY